MAPFRAQTSNRRQRYTAPRRKLNLVPSAVESLPANQNSFSFKTKMMFSVEGLSSSGGKDNTSKPYFSGDHAFDKETSRSLRTKCNSDSSIAERGAHRKSSQRIRRKQEVIASNSSESCLKDLKTPKTKHSHKTREKKTKKVKKEYALQKNYYNILSEKNSVFPDFGDYNKTPIKRLSFSKTEIVSNYDQETEFNCDKNLISFKSFRAGGVYENNLNETYSQISSSSHSLNQVKIIAARADDKRHHKNDVDTNTVVKTSFFSIHNKQTSLKLPFELKNHEKICFGSQAAAAKLSKVKSEYKSTVSSFNKYGKKELQNDLRLKEKRDSKSKIKVSTPNLKVSAVNKIINTETNRVKSQASSEFKRSVSMNLADVSEISSDEIVQQIEDSRPSKLWTYDLKKSKISEKWVFLLKSRKYIGVVLAHSALLCLLLAKAKVINVDKISSFFVDKAQESPLLEVPLDKIGETLYSLNVEALNMPKPFQ